jgi:hypothetical protein
VVDRRARVTAPAGNLAQARVREREVTVARGLVEKLRVEVVGEVEVVEAKRDLGL